MKGENKAALARAMGISRASLYYNPKKEEADWILKAQIEKVMHGNRGYGYRRIADHLGINKKRIQRIMQKFGIKARRRRRSKKYRKQRVSPIYANLLTTIMP